VLQWTFCIAGRYTFGLRFVTLLYYIKQLKTLKIGMVRKIGAFL